MHYRTQVNMVNTVHLKIIYKFMQFCHRIYRCVVTWWITMGKNFFICLMMMFFLTLSVKLIILYHNILLLLFFFLQNSHVLPKISCCHKYSWQKCFCYFDALSLSSNHYVNCSSVSVCCNIHVSPIVFKITQKIFFLMFKH